MISNNSSLRSKSCQQNLRSRKYNQDKLLEDPQPIDPIVQSPIQSINRIGKSHRSVLNLMLGIRNNHVIVCPSMGTIAKRTNLSIKRVYEILEDLQNLGLLNKIYDHFKSNIYVLSSWFSSPKIRNQLKHILWSLRYVVIVPYLSTFFSEKDLRIEKCRQYYILSSIISLNNNTTILPTSINNHSIQRLPNVSRPTTMVDNTTTIRKSYGQKKSLKVNRSLLIEKVSNLNSIVYSIPEFNDEAKRQLAVFPDKVHIEALKVMAGKVGLVNPFGYYRSVCIKTCQKHNIAYEQPDEGLGKAKLTLPIRTQPKISSSVVVVKKENPWIPLPPKASWQLTPEQNLEKIQNYYKSEEVEKYMKHYGEKGKTTIKNLVLKFSEEMKTHTKENIIRWYNNAANMGEMCIPLMEKAKESHSYLRDLPIKPLVIPEGSLGDNIMQAFGSPKKETTLNTGVLENILKQHGIYTPKNEPESITPNEDDYDEVLD